MVEIWIQDMFFCEQSKVIEYGDVEGEPLRYLRAQVREYARVHELVEDQIVVTFESIMK